MLISTVLTGSGHALPRGSRTGLVRRGEIVHPCPVSRWTLAAPDTAQSCVHASPASLASVSVERVPQRTSVRNYRVLAARVRERSGGGLIRSTGAAARPSSAGPA